MGQAWVTRSIVKQRAAIYTPHLGFYALLQVSAKKEGVLGANSRSAQLSSLLARRRFCPRALSPTALLSKLLADKR